MRLIDADSLMEKLNGIWDCNDMTFEPVDGCCIDADCKSCRWRETIEYVKRLVQNQTTASPWHRVEEPPKYTSRYVVWCGVNWYGEGMHGDFMTANYNTVSGRWSVDCDRAINGPLIGDILYWMPIEPPKEDA